MAAHLSGFVLGLLAVLAVTAFILYRYGNVRKQYVIVTAATFISWYFSFIIVFILPLDVSATMYRQCISRCSIPAVTTTPAHTTPNVSMTSTMSVEQGSPGAQSAMACACVEPWLSLPSSVLPTFWKIVYWSSQILTWLILPVMQSFVTAGEFSVLGKLKSALISNLIFYGSYVLIFGACLIYIATRPDVDVNAENIKVIGITASNTWGLFLLVLLYGYGLVDIPRSIWQSSHINLMLQQAYFKVAKIFIESSECQEKYEDTLEEVRQAAEAIRYNHPFRKYIDTILTKCPEEFVRTLRRNDDYVDYVENGNSIPSEKALIKMHLSVISAVSNYNRTRCQKKSLVERAQELEDDVANQNSSNKYFKRSSGKYTGYLKIIHSPKLEWWWRLVLRSMVLKVCAVLVAVCSVMVIWSECVFFIEHPVMSLFALFIRLGNSHFTYTSIEIISILVLLYLCLCAYRTAFMFRLRNYYYLAPNHQTDENSLIFSGMLLCRLTPPLCLNFLSLLQLDSHVTKAANTTETAYTEIMGHMDVIPFIAKGFNIYFPIAIVLLCVCTAARLGARILHCVGFEQFIDDDITQEIVDEGKIHVQREKLQFDRDRAREQRLSKWESTVNGSQIGNRPSSSSDKHWNNYESFDSTSDKTERRPPKASYSKYKRTERDASSDRIELLSDQDVVEYNPSDVHDPAAPATSRTKPSAGIFDDI